MPTYRGSRLVRLAAASALAVTAAIATVLVPSPAHAKPFPGNYDNAVADNGVHTYCFVFGFTTDQSVAHYAMDVLNDTTDMSAQFMSTPTWCLFPENDVWWMEADLAADTRGSRVCALSLVAGVCAGSIVSLDFAELDEGVNDDDWEDRRKTAVHELGDPEHQPAVAPVQRGRHLPHQRHLLDRRG
jgi:hypothetical protein